MAHSRNQVEPRAVCSLRLAEIDALLEPMGAHPADVLSALAKLKAMRNALIRNAQESVPALVMG